MAYNNYSGLAGSLGLSGDIVQDTIDYASPNKDALNYSPLVFPSTDSTTRKSALDMINKAELGGKGSIFGDSLEGLGDIFKDPNMMGNITGLAGALMQAISLPTMLKQAKLQNQSLQHNLDTAKTEQARRNKNISGFNQPVSSFSS